jgi:hypothetical protein
MFLDHFGQKSQISSGLFGSRQCARMRSIRKLMKNMAIVCVADQIWCLLTILLPFEPFVDEILEVVFKQLDERYVKSQATFDLGDWLQYFAFDVMGTMTFSERYGFLETGADVNGMLGAIWDFILTIAPVSPSCFLLL